ncbi:prepilin peptidase [Vibrio vulnificus]|nr:prepilin peptidase [Vibrio vulnificus]
MTLLLISILATYASISDLKHRIIPNGLTLTTLFLCAIFAYSNAYFLQAAAISTSCFILSITLWHLGFWGGGDAKYFPALMLGIKPEFSIEAVCYIGFLGGITSLIIYITCFFSKRNIKETAIPYGIPISLSCLYFLYLSSI